MTNLEKIETLHGKELIDFLTNNCITEEFLNSNVRNSIKDFDVPDICFVETKYYDCLDMNSGSAEIGIKVHDRVYYDSSIYNGILLHGGYDYWNDFCEEDDSDDVGFTYVNRIFDASKVYSFSHLNDIISNGKNNEYNEAVLWERDGI